jgi:hypothetical protein
MNHLSDHLEFIMELRRKFSMKYLLHVKHGDRVRLGPTSQKLRIVEVCPSRTELIVYKYTENL